MYSLQHYSLHLFLGNVEQSATGTSLESASAETKALKLVAPKNLKEGVTTLASASFKGKLYTATKGTYIYGIGEMVSVPNFLPLANAKGTNFRVLGFTDFPNKKAHAL